MKRLLFLALTSLLAACGSSSPNTDVVTGGTNALTTLTFCGTTVDDASTSCPTSPPTTTDSVGGGYWNSVDVYSTPAATKAIIFLHGGGGTNYGMAYDLGLNSADAPSQMANINFGWLAQNGITAVFPQGRGNVSNGGTWTNWVMTSGQDDLTFLQALSAYVKQQYGVSTVYVVGHSNGGMMANRVWCEAPTTFDGYVALAGPPSQHYVAGGSTTCTPAQSDIRPYYGIIGDSDTVLCDNGNATNYGLLNPVSGCDNSATWDPIASPTWTINSTYMSGLDAQAFVNPVLINEDAAQLVRANELCGENALTPNNTLTDSSNTVWTDCNGKLQLQEVIGANHALSYGHGLCSSGDNCSLQSVSTDSSPGSTGLLDTWIVPFLSSIGG